MIYLHIVFSSFYCNSVTSCFESCNEYMHRTTTPLWSSDRRFILRQ